MYSKNNERKSVFVERYIGTLKSKIHRFLKSVYIDDLNDIVEEYNST